MEATRVSVIAATRRTHGLTQADVARRCGVTVGAVSQWEQSERRGTIRVETLGRALQAMGAAVSIKAYSVTPARVVTYADLPVSLSILAARGTERALWRASRRVRTAGVAYDMLAEGVDLNLAEAWNLAEGFTATMPVATYVAARAVTRSYDAAVAAVTDPDWEPCLITPAGQRLVPDGDVPVVAARVLWAATAIANGVPPLQARHAANTALVRAGYDWIILGPYDRSAYAEAVAWLQATGDANRFLALLGSRYDMKD